MAYAIHTKYTNPLVGLFVLLTLGVVVAGGLMAPQTRRWFVTSQKLVVRLPPAGSLGLRPGADVLVLGSTVGTVDDISVDDAGNMDAYLSIRGNFIRFIRADSAATIRKPLGIGETVIEINRGSGPPLASANPTISAVADVAPTELVEQTMTEIRQEAVPALRDLRKAIGVYADLGTALHDRQDQVRQTLDRLNHLQDQVDHGDGLAAKVISDRQVAQDMTSTLANIRASSEKMSSVMDETTATLRPINRTAAQMPELLLEIQQTLQQARRVSETMQRSWLLSGPSDARQPASDRLGPDRMEVDH